MPPTIAGMAPKKRKAPEASERPRTQKVVDREVLPKALTDLAARRAAWSGVCGACLLPLERDDKVGLLDNCTHVFHVDCIERWSRTENTCPQCKLRFFWLASYPPSGKRVSLERVA